MKKIKVLELFGGIGACTNALRKLNIPFEVVDYVEIDKYAVKSYNAIYGTNFKPQDIIAWDKDIDVDLIMHGSPCQDFSIAGKQKGGDKGSGTRSSLMYETIRIVEQIKPKYILWENVKNVLSKKHKHNFHNYINTLDLLGYNSYYKILNAKNYGIPQNRERVFTVSIRKDINKTFTFPQKQELKLKLKDILEDEVNEKYYLNDNANYSQYSLLKIKSNVVKGNIVNTITASAMQSFNHNNCHLIRVDSCLRKLTPKECWILMGFDDEDFEKAAQVNSNTQLYKQAGNSIVVNVLEAILKKLLLEKPHSKNQLRNDRQFTIFDYEGNL